MHYKSKSSKKVIHNCQVSLQHLYNLNNFIQNQQNITKYVSKEIKNEVNKSKKNQKIIEKTFYKINEDGQNLIRRYEQEKQKHEKLQFLVKHYEEVLYKAKLDKSLQQKNNIQIDKLLQLSNEVEEKEKNVQKVVEKINNSTYQLQKKIDSIRAMRSQRSIFSALFDKIQRQLCNLEHCYKVLVIQRTIQQHRYRQHIEELSKCQNQAQKVLSILSKEQTERQSIDPIIKAKFNQQPQIQEQVQPCHKSSNYPSRFKINTQSQLSKQKVKKCKYQNDFINLQRERKIKNILNDFEISSFRQIPDDISTLDLQNDKNFQQIIDVSEEIKLLQSKICNLKKGKKKIDKSASKKLQYSAKKKKIEEIASDIKDKRLQLNQFINICKIVVKRIKENQGQDETICQFINDEEEIKFYMGVFQAYFEHPFTNLYHSTSLKVNNNKFSMKRLTSLLNYNHIERNHMSIYQEKDLLQFAKKNLQNLQKSNVKTQK